MKRILVLCCLLLVATAVFAAPPRTMNYQGTLTDAVGLPVPDGNYTLTFRLWNASIGGTPVWSESQSASVDGGVFNVILGLVNPMTEPFENQRWLGVQVGVDPELAPRTPLTSVPSAFNVVDGAAVTSLNGLTDDVTITAGPNISVSTSGQNVVISGTGVVTDADWAVSGNDMTSVPTGNVGIGVPVPGSKLHVDGTVLSGDGDTSGRFESTIAGSASPSYFGDDYGSFGSEISLRTDEGGLSLVVQPDVDDTGGFLQVNRDEFTAGLIVDGNFGGSNSTRVTISGQSSAASFRTDLAGNASVNFSPDAVAADEMLDEPGIASAKSNAASPYNLTTTMAVITSRTIVAPADGYVVVTASYEVDINHSNGTSAYSTIGVSSSSTSLPDNQDHSFYLPSTAASGIYLVPASAMGVFPVTAGSNTFYLLGSKNSASVDIQVWDVQLTNLYVPTAYGTVTGTDVGAFAALPEQFNDAPGEAGPTSSDLAAERSQSERDASSRVDAELAAMRSQLADLQRQVEDLNRTSGR